MFIVIGVFGLLCFFTFMYSYLFVLFFMFYLLFFGRSVLLVSPFSLVLCLYGLEYYEVPELDISCIYLYIPLFIYASCLFYVYLSMFMYSLFLCIYFIYLLVCFVLYFFKFHLRQGNSLKNVCLEKE